MDMVFCAQRLFHVHAWLVCRSRWLPLVQVEWPGTRRQWLPPGSSSSTAGLCPQLQSSPSHLPGHALPAHSPEIQWQMSFEVELIAHGPPRCAAPEVLLWQTAATHQWLQLQTRMYDNNGPPSCSAFPPCCCGGLPQPPCWAPHLHWTPRLHCHLHSEAAAKSQRQWAAPIGHGQHASITKYTSSTLDLWRYRATRSYDARENGTLPYCQNLLQAEPALANWLVPLQAQANSVGRNQLIKLTWTCLSCACAWQAS